MKKGWSYSRYGGYTKKLDKTVRSNFEAIVKKNLEKTGKKFGYETIKIPYQLEHTYKPDFILSNGIIVEAKGLFHPEDRTKHLQIKKQYPELDIRFLFQRDQYISNKTKHTRYSDWCKKNGFKYAIGNGIPLAWLEEEGGTHWQDN